MSHISIERLASFVDELPLPEEAAHLAVCPACVAEIAAHRRLARLAVTASGAPTPPLSNWAQLSERLHAEDLLRLPQRGGRWRRATTRVAASLAFLLAGVALGRGTSGVTVPFLPPAGAPAQPAASAADLATLTFQTPDEAVGVLRKSQALFQAASAYLVEQDTAQRFLGLNPDVYRTRLAALDDMAATSRAALYKVPQDPMLNLVYLTTLGAREATLRQLGTALPATDRRLERY